MQRKRNTKRGFTLIEILVVIGIIGILATVVLVAVNPSRQFKQARDSQRVANINTILNAIGQNMADHEGTLHCDTGPREIPTTEVTIANDEFNLAECIVPDYLPKMPYDPSPGRGHYTSEDDYAAGYQVVSDAQGRISVSAIGEIQEDIVVTR